MLCPRTGSLKGTSKRKSQARRRIVDCFEVPKHAGINSSLLRLGPVILDMSATFFLSSPTSQSLSGPRRNVLDGQSVLRKKPKGTLPTIRQRPPLCQSGLLRWPSLGPDGGG